MEIVKRETNYNSISTARMASILVSIANGFAGAKHSKPLPVDDLLPFPLDEKQFKKNESTISTLQKLIKKGKIPVHVIAALNPVLSL